MKFSYNKLKYMASIAGPEKYIDILFPFSRYRTKLDDWNYIQARIENKSTDEYQDFEFYHEFENGNGYEEIRKQGYYCFTREFLDEQRLFYQDRILDKNPLGEKSERYLRKIIRYCQGKNIPITLFVSPIDELQLISTEHYDNYIVQIRDVAEEYGVDFYDFNLIKEEYLDIQHGEYFMDIGHLNDKGAGMFTSLFSEVVSRTASENERYFYDSYEEKLRSVTPAIYGLYYRDSDGARTYHIASNRERGMEYRVTSALPANESGGGVEQTIIQDFAENKKFDLPIDQHGIFTVEARITGQMDPVQTLVINY